MYYIFFLRQHQNGRCLSFPSSWFSSAFSTSALKSFSFHVLSTVGRALDRRAKGCALESPLLPEDQSLYGGGG